MVDDVQYIVISDTEVVLDAWDESYSVTYNIEIPEMVNGFYVTAIGDGAFHNCSMKTITIPDRVTSIGERAFEWCKELTEITLPDGITEIGSSAFEYCSSLTEIKLPAGITEIKDKMFYDCGNLMEITIPPSVSKIGNDVFEYCYGLETVNISDLSAWCRIDFGSNHPFALNENSKLYLNGELITDLVIPEDITEIKSGAFYKCKSLRSVKVHSGFTAVDYETFFGCHLDAINIPDLSVWCKNDKYGGFYGKADNLYLNGELVTDLIIPDGVTDVKESTFNGFTGLTSVTIPKGVTSIGDFAFSGCTGLTSVTIPKGVTSIGDFAFSGCSGLTSVTIPSSITSIGFFAFEDCDNLKKVYISDLSAWCKIDFGASSIYCNPLWNGGELYLNGKRIDNLVIPEDITVVKDYAFAGCNVKSITIHSGVISFGRTELYRYSDFVAVYISDLSAWCRIDFESNTFGKSYKLYLNGIQVIDLVIPDDVTMIKNYAFSGCSGLRSVTIPDAVTSIGSSAFENCRGLTSVTIPEAVTSIGSYAFSGCSGLRSVTIPEGVTSIERSAFSGCSGLTSVTIPESVTSIGNYAFSGCSGLASVTIPKGITSIGSYAFKNCSSLTSIVLGDGIEEFGDADYDWVDYCTVFEDCEISEIILLDDSFEYLNKIEGIGISDGANVYGFINEADAPSSVRYRQLELDIPDYTYTGHGPEYISVLENTSSYRIECTGVDGDESIDVGSHDATTAEVCVYNKEDAGSRSTTYHVTLPKKYSYTVNKAPLTVTAESFSVDYGETVAADDFWYSYSGFVNGEDEDVLTELPVIECEAAFMPEAGEYPITVSGGEAKNYEFKYEQGTLTVLQIPQTMVWEQDLSDLSVGDMVVLTAEASSGMPVSYSVSNGDVVEIVKSGGKMRLHCLSPGTVTVTATEQESRNYLPVSLEKEVTVTAFGGVGTVDAGAVGCYPNPAVERLNVTGTADGSVIRIFDLDGRLLGTQKGEDGTTVVDVSGLAQGDYLLVVETGGKTATLRFTKK